MGTLLLGGRPDRDFPFLTRDEGREFRALAVAAFARRGVPVTVRGDHLEGSDAEQYRLHNLAALCHHIDAGRRSWPDAIAHHVDTVLAAFGEPDDDVEWADLREHVIPRLVDPRSLPADARATMRYARPWGDSVVEAFAYDAHHSARYLRDDDLARHDRDMVRAAALDNLRRDPVDERSTADAGDGAILHTLFGESSYAASRAVILEDELERVGDHPDGAFFVIPDRSNLLFHPIVDRMALTALRTLSAVAQTAHAKAASPISPHVFWWRDGEATQVTRVDEKGRFRFEDDDALDDVLRVVASR
jgi:hypothetical protein